MSKGRLEAFSDGVFAVAATLLIFNIQIDKTAPGGLLSALLAAWPKYAAYVASFLTIGVMWLNHHGMFARIARLDRQEARHVGGIFRPGGQQRGQQSARS